MGTFTVDNQNQFIREVVGNIHNEEYNIDDTSSILDSQNLKKKNKEEIIEYILNSGTSLELAIEFAELICNYEKITGKFANKTMILLASYYRHS